MTQAGKRKGKRGRANDDRRHAEIEKSGRRRKTGTTSQRHEKGKGKGKGGMCGAVESACQLHKRIALVGREQEGGRAGVGGGGRDQQTRKSKGESGGTVPTSFT